MSITPSLLMTWAFLLMFILGGFTGVMLGNPAIDNMFHDTYFVVAHFHFTLSLGAVFGVMLASLMWMDIFYFRNRSQFKLNLLVFCLVVGAIILFTPLHLTGITGLPRRIPDYPDVFISTTLICLGGLLLLLYVILTFI